MPNSKNQNAPAKKRKTQNQKFSTTVNLPVELTFEILEPIVYQGQLLPAMVDITKIDIAVLGPRGRLRVIDLTRNFGEQDLLALEDEIIEALQEDS